MKCEVPETAGITLAGGGTPSIPPSLAFDQRYLMWVASGFLAPNAHGNGRETPLRVRARPGTLAPLSDTCAPGMVFISFAGDSAGGSSAKPTDEVERCRRNEYSARRTSGRPGVGRISAPVFERRGSGNNIVAALGIACATEILTAQQIAVWGPQLRKHAIDLEQQIAH